MSFGIKEDRYARNWSAVGEMIGFRRDRHEAVFLFALEDQEVKLR